MRLCTVSRLLASLAMQMRTGRIYGTASRRGAGLTVRSARNFLRIFKKLRPDVVHLHNPTPTIFAAPAARMAGVPSIVSTRHSLVAAPRKLSVEIKYGVAGIFCDWIVGICDATTNNLKVAHRLRRAQNCARIQRRAPPRARIKRAMAAEERVYDAFRWPDCTREKSRADAQWISHCVGFHANVAIVACWRWRRIV